MASGNNRPMPSALENVCYLNRESRPEGEILYLFHLFPGQTNYDKNLPFSPQNSAKFFFFWS